MHSAVLDMLKPYNCQTPDDYKNALKYYENELKYNPGDISILAPLARCYKITGDNNALSEILSILEK